MIARLCLVILPIISFLAGSIPAGYVIGRLKGIDIRQHGSGNIGSTNVGRVLGRPWGWLVFAIDFLKGFLPVFLGGWFLSGLTVPWECELSLVLSSVAAILGHNYTPWLGFKGGKGIATSAGVLGALIPWVLVVAWLSWQAIVLTSRRVSLGSVGASLVLPIACSFFYPGQWMKLALAVAACFFGLWRHRSNMERLLKGEEPKVGQHVDPQSELASKKKN